MSTQKLFRIYQSPLQNLTAIFGIIQFNSERTGLFLNVYFGGGGGGGGGGGV